MITLADIHDAKALVYPYIHRTPLVKSATLSRKLNTNVYLKLELFQKTGSFKPRGAFNKMLRFSPEQHQQGIVAVSGGNFAQAVAYAGQVLDVKTRILMPSYTPKNYVEATQSYGAEIEFGPDIAALFRAAAEYGQQGRSFMHPYDDPYMMAGHGTIAAEILEDVPNLTDVIVSIGGGGLMTGTTIGLKSLKPDVRVWTVETEGADAMAQALKAGKPVDIRPTSLAKTLGAPNVAEDALHTVQQHVSEHVVVSDRDAYFAQRFLLERTKVLPELAASCTLAAAERLQQHFSPDSHLCLILCGGNVSLDNLVDYKKQFEATA